jgi:hypothetical protein
LGEHPKPKFLIYFFFGRNFREQTFGLCFHWAALLLSGNS